MQPGYVYKFQFKKDNQYPCISCEKMNKYRIVTVVDVRIIGRNIRYWIIGLEHPVLDHHANCQPEPESAVQSVNLDRKMRVTVRETEKRPREACNETLECLSKKY